MEENWTLLQQKMKTDEAFVEKLYQQETLEEVQALLKENGLDMTIEEINAAREALITSIAPSERDELSEEDLDRVAGGSIWDVPWTRMIHTW